MTARALRLALTVLVTGACVAYLAWKIDLSHTGDVLADANPGLFALAAAIMVVTTVPMAWRWQLLLAVKGVREPLSWLTRTYFVAYSANQVLPTSLGGDAVRVVETARRHPGRAGLITGTVVLDRALGGIATVGLAAIGFVLALGRYDIGAYLWMEAAFVTGAGVLGFLAFSARARRSLAWLAPLLDRVRLERSLRAVYEGIHSYRSEGRLLLALALATLALQAVRILPVWLVARAVDIDLSVRPFYVMGPVLFFVLLFPFTINGFAVREAFFVSFLGQLGVAAEPAFAAGFLFFLVTVVMALPGLGILLWEGARGAPRPGIRRAPG
ncbi:MAG: lysylphosphatidylglycerol synthase transmembrane domain-containing protein [Gaiellaceae bacterium]